MYGCREDSTREDWDPETLWDELPSRRWCRALYAANRGELVEAFENRPYSVGAAWPISEFESDQRVRREARAVVRAHWERLEEDPRQLLAK